MKYLNIYRLPHLNQVLKETGHRTLSNDVRVAHRGSEGAIRYLLGRYLSNTNEFIRFKSPITQPEYRKYLCNIVQDEEARANIEKLNQFDPSNSIRHIFEFREDLRSICPLALTPESRGDYLRWLLLHGVHEYSFPPEYALWYHFELEEDPSRGLVTTYRRLPEWQKNVPQGLTRYGWQTLKSWIQSKYQINKHWIRTARLTDPACPNDELKITARLRSGKSSEIHSCRTSNLIHRIQSLKSNVSNHSESLQSDQKCQSVNVLGFFRYTSGLQQAVKGMVKSLNSVQIRTRHRDFPVLFLREPRDRAGYDDCEIDDITIINTGIDLSISEAYRKSGLAMQTGVYRIATWWWELEQIPDKWLDRAEGINEIWAPTTFIEKSMKKAFSVPVITMNPGLELDSFAKRDREYFQLPASKYVFLTVFDMNSRMQRKNPLAVIKAFLKAFRGNNDVLLVIKVSPPESYYQDQWDLLRTTIEQSDNITLIDRVLSRSDLLALFDVSDCIVSLHRSEGLGLVCAEGMLLGKPVIATNYGGNTDFMNSSNSFLVDYNLIEIDEDIDPYPKGFFWADASVDHAAELMTKSFEQQSFSRMTGQKAQADLIESFSIQAAGYRMQSRLDEITQKINSTKKH